MKFWHYHKRSIYSNKAVSMLSSLSLLIIHSLFKNDYVAVLCFLVQTVDVCTYVSLDLVRLYIIGTRTS